MGQTPVIVATVKFDLQLKQNATVSDVVLKLLQETQLSDWMQFDEQTCQSLPKVDRVVVHIEQMSARNPHWKRFELELGSLLQQRASDYDRCVVKMPSYLHRAGGIMHHLVDQIVEEPRLVPASYSKKGQKPPPARQDDMAGRYG